VTVDYSVRRVCTALNETLQGYLEAQYHIRDEGLIAERSALLREAGAVSQPPYVEATPVYETASVKPYAQLDIPKPARDLLVALGALTKPTVGVFEPAYAHQARALELFLSKGRDLIVATGTGSGKTESFLMPILGSLAVEAAERPDSARMHGCRAMLLYPMNALVSDQLSRVRRLFGDERVATMLAEPRGRRVRFGMYTSRTPYAGMRSGTRDARYIQPIFEEFYLRRDPSIPINQPGAFAERAEMRDRLRPKGKWPCKDLVGFFGADKITETTVQKGKQAGQKRTYQNFTKGGRLETQPGDTELFTRHEMLKHCPDLLVTNYSMLEYMMLRPIERSIFQQTRDWLARDSRNHFILVLDEAHTYRGASGAEVALLVRRLRARLGVPRDRFRCILTSASLGRGQEAEAAVKRFACDLTGLAHGAEQIELVTGTMERREVRVKRGPRDATALAAFALADFQRYAIEPQKAREAVAKLAIDLGWPPPAEPLGQYLFDHLDGWEPVETLIQEVSGQAKQFGELVARVFPGEAPEQAEAATEMLLALVTFARRQKDDRVLMPTRLHLLFRGLPGLYACADPRCTQRRVTSPQQGGHVLGRLHTQPLTACGCGARVFELLTHRDCGAAFLRGYLRDPDGDFVWHEPSGAVGQSGAAPLLPVQLLVEQPHLQCAKHEAEVVECWLDPLSGRLQCEKPAQPDRFLRCFKPAANPQAVGALEFAACPVCLKGWKKNSSKIMDLVTKGEAPFAALVKTQLLIQPPQSNPSPDAPNGGRKVLLFSDGRQRAARLARDIPREVELDSFRQALALAAKDLQALGKEPRLGDSLYLAFVGVAERYHLAFFDGKDQARLRQDCRRFREAYDGDLQRAIDDWGDIKPPFRYHVALLRQLCRAFYSIPAVTVGYLPPRKSALTLLGKDVSGIGLTLDAAQLEALAVAWAAGPLEDFSWNRELGPSFRAQAAGFRSDDWSSKGDIPRGTLQALTEKLKASGGQTEQLRAKLRERLSQDADKGKGLMLKPDEFILAIDFGREWYRCAECTRISPVAPLGRCPHCGSEKTRASHPDKDAYLSKRQGYWRRPVREVLEGTAIPSHVTAEEHTAQLSQRDAGIVYATTERYELRFQDVLVNDREGPIDVLSCTTTMEVGVDIGSLVAVGLRNVPPQRENYQQRAGRAGRRGSAVSTVVTYGQNGPHDSYYFHNPRDIVAGPPRQPLIKIDNPKIARRHVHAYLFQTFFHETLEAAEAAEKKGGKKAGGKVSGSLFDAWGETTDFFAADSDNPFSLARFRDWVATNVLAASGRARAIILGWLPFAVVAGKDGSAPTTKQVEAWICRTASELLASLAQFAKEMNAKSTEEEAEETEEEDAEAEASDEDKMVASAKDVERLTDVEGRRLINFQFDKGLLPTYAFPTDLCSFLVEGWVKRRKGGSKERWDLIVKERPQQAIAKALSEYAPGRTLVIDKETYRSGGVAAAVPPTVIDRAEPLFDSQIERRYIFCPVCTFVREPQGEAAATEESCPLCGTPGDLKTAEMVTPQVFLPEGGEPLDELDRDQELSQSTSAQFPVPFGEDDVKDWRALTPRADYTFTPDRQLVIVNKGDGKVQEGFSVCTKCGSARIYDPDEPAAGVHDRPYKIQRPRDSYPTNCSGAFRQVFLGHQFLSDLMLLRIPIKPPFADALKVEEVQTGQAHGTSVALHALNDALRTLAESLLLAASRRLQIDPGEFSTGYRLLPKQIGFPLRGDVYLFDTLAGGAGYAAQVGEELLTILREDLARLLATCPSKDCDRSCYECIRHYGNQFYHGQLDRGLGAALLRYILDGTTPERGELEAQARRLKPLRRMFELEGFVCRSDAALKGQEVPLLLETNRGRKVAIGTYHGLLDQNQEGFDHPLESLESNGSGARVVLLNEYLLSRNLPAARGKLDEILRTL
jgi:hypothetical protein